MQVILFKSIERLGMQGDVVNVAPGYYRNYLGPQGVALEATKANLSRMEARRTKLRAEADRQLGEADILAKQLKEVKIKYVMKATDNERLFGSVQDHDIIEKLHAAGFSTLERRQVALREPIKTVGTHHVRIKLLGQVEAQVTVVIEAEGAAEAKAAEAKVAEAKAAKAAAEAAAAAEEAAPAVEAAPEGEQPQA